MAVSILLNLHLFKFVLLNNKKRLTKKLTSFIYFILGKGVEKVRKYTVMEVVLLSSVCKFVLLMLCQVCLDR